MLGCVHNKLSENCEERVVHIDVEKKESQDRSLRNAIFILFLFFEFSSLYLSS